MEAARPLGPADANTKEELLMSMCLARLDNSSDCGWKTRALHLLIPFNLVDGFVCVDNLAGVNFSLWLVEIVRDGICYAWFTNRSMARASYTKQNPWRTLPGIAPW